jgi:hypothetical protein
MTYLYSNPPRIKFLLLYLTNLLEKVNPLSTVARIYYTIPYVSTQNKSVQYGVDFGDFLYITTEFGLAKELPY